MKKIIILLFALTVLTSSAYAEPTPEEETITVTAPAVTELIEAETDPSSESEDGELVADEDPIIIVSYPEEEVENGFIKPFEEYTPTDIFTFLILLIKIFENVIKLFIHKWGFANW